MLSEWHDTAVYLSSRVGAGRLDLSLVCDVDDEHWDAYEAVQLAVAAIRLFPRLKNCHVRLSEVWSRQLQRLAEETALQACRAAFPPQLKPGAGASSALLDPPPELRLRILEYTDLITPWKKVSWSRQYHGYQVCRPPCERCPHCVHHGCRLSRCDRSVLNPSPGGDLASSPGCFCRRRHAAFSSSCICWAPPTHLFLVCRVLCRDAQFVLFSRNRFIVHDFHSSMPWDLPAEQLEGSTDACYPHGRFAASEFMRDIVPAHCLAHLRFLELIYPPYVPHAWPRSKTPTMLDWRATLDWIRGHISAPALSVRVVMADCFGYGMYKTRTDLTKDQGERILKGYAYIMDPFKRLVREDGLAGFFIQVASPWRWNSARNQIAYHGQQWLEEAEENLKRWCERNVRGGDANLGSRKGEPTKSVWQRWYL